MSAQWLTSVGRQWARLTPLRDAGGAATAWVQVDCDGNVFLPFDPAQATRLLLTERYRDWIPVLALGERELRLVTQPARIRRLLADVLDGDPPR